MRGERRDLCCKIVAQEVQLLSAVVCRMNSHLCGWKGEYQPVMAGIHRVEAKNVAKERAVR